jgi:hypothetical protein
MGLFFICSFITCSYFLVRSLLRHEWLFFIRFGFYKKKITKLKFFIKKPKLIQTDRFRFGSVFKTKTSSNRFDSIFSVWLGFFGLTRFWRGFFRFGSVFLVWLGFFQFFSVWVRFGFFDFRLIKPKPNRTSKFF